MQVNFKSVPPFLYDLPTFVRETSQISNMAKLNILSNKTSIQWTLRSQVYLSKKKNFLAKNDFWTKTNKKNAYIKHNWWFIMLATYTIFGDLMCITLP